MAKLTEKARNKIPASKFGEPKERKYPMPDKNHARNALARVSQQENKGNISASEASKVRKKAHAILNK